MTIPTRTRSSEKSLLVLSLNQSRMHFVSPHLTPAHIHSIPLSLNKSILSALILIENPMSPPFLQHEKPCLTLYKTEDKIILELIYLRCL
jgi:hypothetical protein